MAITKLANIKVKAAHCDNVCTPCKNPVGIETSRNSFFEKFLKKLDEVKTRAMVKSKKRASKLIGA